MFEMDLAEMDRLKDTLFRASAQSGEALYIMKNLREEMLTDIELGVYDTAGTIDERMASAITALLNIKESLYSLGCVVSDAEEKCVKGEKTKTGIITGEVS